MLNMTRKTKWPYALLIVSFALVTSGIMAQDQRPQQPTLGGALTVNDLAEKPDEHLGQVQVVGVVAAIAQGKGFVLVDPREYANCGLTCLAEPDTKRIPVRWIGDAPMLKQTIRVAGILSRNKEGLSFAAQEIGAP
jgi:hypothetical protein